MKQRWDYAVTVTSGHLLNAVYVYTTNALGPSSLSEPTNQLRQGSGYRPIHASPIWQRERDRGEKKK